MYLQADAVESRASIYSAISDFLVEVGQRIARVSTNDIYTVSQKRVPP